MTLGRSVDTKYSDMAAASENFLKQIPKDAVIAGYTVEGFTIFVGKKTLNSNDCVCKLIPSLNVRSVGIEDVEHELPGGKVYACQSKTLSSIIVVGLVTVHYRERI